MAIVTTDPRFVETLPRRAEQLEPFAPGWPGLPARWTSSVKRGVGTAVSRDSRVWFTLSHGIVNENKGTAMLFAEREHHALAPASTAPWLARSAGFVGVSHGWQELRRWEGIDYPVCIE